MALDAAKLVVLTDVEGLYLDWPASTDVVTTISAAELEALLPNLSSGMVPKMGACLQAVRGGVAQAHVIDGRVPHVVLLEVFDRRRRRHHGAAGPPGRGPGRRGCRMTVGTTTYTERWNAALMGNYGTPPLTLVRGRATRVWDDAGREYLDLVAGIAVNASGTRTPPWSGR